MLLFLFLIVDSLHHIHHFKVTGSRSCSTTVAKVDSIPWVFVMTSRFFSSDCIPISFSIHFLYIMWITAIAKYKVICLHLPVSLLPLLALNLVLDIIPYSPGVLKPYQSGTPMLRIQSHSRTHYCHMRTKKT